MIPVQTQKKLDELAGHYSKKLLSDVYKVLSSSKYRRSGKLLDSLHIVVSRATQTEAPVILLRYADQGYYIGYKSPQWTRLPPVDDLLEWAKNISFAGPIPGYKANSSSNLPPWKAKERIVWAIAKNKRKFDTWKAKPWKREAKLSDLLKDLNKSTIEAWVEDVEQILSDAISKGTSTS